jgi:HK97 family phage portal protein
MNLKEKIGLKLLGVKNISLKDPKAFQQAFGDWIDAYSGGNKDYVGAVYSAIDTWGLMFAKANFRLYETKKNSVQELIDHPFRMLFDNPNNYSSWWEIKYKIGAHFGLFGNSYILKLRKNSRLETNGNFTNRGEVVSYQHLLPNLVRRESGNGQFIDHYTYYFGDKKIKISRNDVIDFRYPDPYGDAQGFPIIQSIADQVTVNRLQLAYMKKFFERGGFLGAIFTTPKEMTTASFNRLKKMLVDEYGGIDNASKIGLFDSDVKPVPTAYSPKEIEMGNQATLNRENIFSAFKVPKVLVGLGELDNKATADASLYVFTSLVIDPILSYVDNILTKHARMEFEKNLKVEHDILAPKDQQGQLNYYDYGLKNGWLSINEVREMEGWNKLKGEIADNPTVNVGGALVSVSSGKQLGVEENGGNMNKKSMDEDLKTLTWKQFDRRLSLAERRFNRKIEGYFDGQRRRILEAVKDNFIVEGVFNLEEEDMILWQLLEIEIYSIMEAGYRFGAYEYDHSPTMNRDVMRNEFNRIGRNTVLINQTTYESIKGIRGNSYEEVSQEINNKYESFKNRINSIVNTTAQASFNAGLLRVMIDAGLTKKIWLSSRDSRVRDTKGENHRIMDGVTIGIEESFEVPSRSGTDLMLYPGDPSGSPENIVNDRCTIIGE